MDIDDIWMRNACCCLRLTLKALDKFLVILILLMKNLDGDSALQKLILCPIDIRHAAAAHQRLQRVASIQDTLNHVRSS